MLKLWNTSLIVLTFGLTIFGTFLTRSGIIGSVHAFTQGSIGAFFLGFLALVLLGSFSLLAWRMDRLRAQGELDSIVSRESVFLLNNLFLVAATFTVFFGTIFPLLSEAIKGTKVSVGAPFFNLVNIPLFLGLIFLMGVGPLIAWRRASADNLRHNFLGPGAAGVLLGFGLLALGLRSPGAVLTFALCGFVAGTVALEFARGVRVRRVHREERLGRALIGLVLHNRRRYGGYIVHLGILLIVAGITGSSLFSTQRLVTVAPGAFTQIGEYRVRFDGLTQSTSNGALVITARLRAFAGGRDLGPLEARRDLFLSREAPSTTDVALRSTPRDDLYVILTGWTADGRAALRLFVNPLVMWIWAGGLVLTLGAVISMVPERRLVSAAVHSSGVAWSPAAGL